MSMCSCLRPQLCLTLRVNVSVCLNRLRTHGSPRWQGCWADETANSQLKRMSSAAHSLVWHARVLATWAAHDGKRLRA